jgi:hypothetical protein
MRRLDGFRNFVCALAADDVARYLSVFSGFIGIGDTMATTVGRCFDTAAAMRLIPDYTKNK